MRGKFDFESNQWVETPFAQTAIEAETTAPPREGVWSSPAPVVPKYSKPALIISISLVVLGAVLLPFTHGASLPLLGVGLGLIGSSANNPESASSQATARDRALLEDNEDSDVCLVTISIFRGAGNWIGGDRGVAWFADDQLFFNGHRTSFALGGQDIRSLKDWSRWITPSGEIELPDTILALAHPVGDAFLEITPMVVPSERGNARRAAEMRFLKRLYEFKRKRPVSKGSRQWPPLEA